MDYKPGFNWTRSLAMYDMGITLQKLGLKDGFKPGFSWDRIHAVYDIGITLRKLGLKDGF